jgi:hypothetical protein
VLYNNTNLKILPVILCILIYVNFGNVLVDSIYSNIFRIGLIGAFVLVYFTFIRSPFDRYMSVLELAIFLNLIFIAFWTVLPFREYNNLSSFLIIISIVFIFTIKSDFRISAFVMITKVLFITAILTIITFLLLIIFKENLPYFDILHYGRPYRLYVSGSSSLVSNHFTSPFYGARLSSLFAEPGHAAIFYLITWWASKGYVSDRIRFVLLIGGGLTFSAAFYVGISLVLLLRYWKLLVIPLFIMMLTLPTSPSNYDVNKDNNSIEYRLISRHLVALNEDNPLDRRTKTDWDSTFINMSSLSIFTGLGGMASKSLEKQSSDFRGFIFKFGLFGLFLVLFLNFLLLLKSFKARYFIFGLSGVLIFIFTLAHRHWLVDNFSFLFLFLFGMGVGMTPKNFLNTTPR